MSRARHSLRVERSEQSTSEVLRAVNVASRLAQSMHDAMNASQRRAANEVLERHGVMWRFPCNDARLRGMTGNDAVRFLCVRSGTESG